MTKNSVVLILLSLLIFCSCSNDNNNDVITPTTLTESEVTYIQLTGPAAGRDNEFSGLAWHGENLILLPQYPFNDSDTIETRGVLFSIPKERIVDYLNGTNTSAIEPDTMFLEGRGLETFNSHGSGYEAIAFDDDNNYSYCSIESNNLGFTTTGYLVRGYGFNLDASTLVNIESQSEIFNISEETIFIFNGRIYTIHEANGKNVNPNPVAHAFHMNLADEITIPFPNIESRITDATTPDENGKFWVINYFWQGDSSDLKPSEDELATKFGMGETNAAYPGIERLIQLEITETEIKLVDRAPIYLKLNDDGGRNWEGIAKLDDMGLLIITDKFPSTILGFVKF
jgi:hypothetical protein